MERNYAGFDSVREHGVTIGGMSIIFVDGVEHPMAEYEVYHTWAVSTHPDAVSVEIRFEGDEALLYYKMRKIPFERIRRITGYLVGSTDKWNKGKLAELKDRTVNGGDA